MIEGTVPALLTPFDADGHVDLGLLDAHVAWLHDRGVRCVSPLGTTGEGPSLSLAERREVIARLARHPSGVAVVPGTGCNALPETIELSRFALEQGAVAVLVMPPWYYPASAAGTAEYFRRLVDALPDPRVLAYHIPSFTGVPIEDDVLRLPGIVGAKDSGGVLAHTLRWLEEFPQLAILNGSDAVAEAFYAAGGRGTLTLLANIAPERLEAIRAGRDVAEHQRVLMELRQMLDSFPRHAALKHLLHVVSGLPRSAVRAPLDELTAEQQRALEAAYHLV